MMRLGILLLLMIFLLLGPRTLPASDKISLTGYYKNFSVVLDQPEIKNQKEKDKSIMGSVNNRLRLNIFHRASDRVSLNLAYDISPLVQDRSLSGDQILGLGLKAQTYRAVDFDSRIYPDEEEQIKSFGLFHNLDRILVTINSRLADIYLGRQAIAWGAARVINPTDVIAPYAFNELDVEDRRGVDAVRVRVPISLLEEIDVGYVFGEDFKFENSAMFLRGKFYHYRTDFSLLLTGFHENFMMGFDLARSLGGAGFWIEGGYVFASALSSDQSKSEPDYFRSSVGLDYSLRDGTYLFFEYHFNQAGACKSEDYLNKLKTAPYTEGPVYLMGQHYFAPGISYQTTLLIALTGEVLINLTDPSLFLVPQLEYNIAENIYLSAGAYLGLGNSPEMIKQQEGEFKLQLGSEFGSYPNLYFTSFRIYF
jgi:hypothetical protein